MVLAIVSIAPPSTGLESVHLLEGLTTVLPLTNEFPLILFVSQSMLRTVPGTW